MLIKYSPDFLKLNEVGAEAHGTRAATPVFSFHRFAIRQKKQVFPFFLG
jgi:hypothetical protein